MADRQTCKQVFLLKIKALGTLDRRVHHLGYQGGPKSLPHILFVLTILDCFDLGTSLKKYVLSQGCDVAYIGHWPRVIYLFDRQTDRETNRQADIYILPCFSSQTSYHCLSMDCLQTVSELYMYISSVSLPVNELYQALASLCQSILCGYDNVTFFGGGGGCLVCLIDLVVTLLTGFEAFGHPVKDFAFGVSVIIWDGASVVHIIKSVGASTVQ